MVEIIDKKKVKVYFMINLKPRKNMLFFDFLIYRTQIKIQQSASAKKPVQTKLNRLILDRIPTIEC